MSPYIFPITHLQRNFRDDLPFNLKRDYPSGLEKSGASHQHLDHCARDMSSHDLAHLISKGIRWKQNGE